MGDRLLATHEIVQLLRAETVVKAHREREASQDWAAWAEAHPRDNELLTSAALAANKDDNGE